MSTNQTQSAASPDAPSFTPVPVRPRYDGWTPERQTRFIAVLAATGCVTQAADDVGMSTRAAYDLYNRTDAASFRAAWDAALTHLSGQLATVMTNRAIHGTATPIFYKGEQIGERRTYDNRLGMWMLARLDPSRYGAWQDGYTFRHANPDAPTNNLHCRMRDLASDLVDDSIGRPRERRAPQPVTVFADDPAVTATDERDRQVRRMMEQDAENAALVERMELIGRGEIDPNDPASYTRWQERKRRASAERHAAVARPLDSGTDAP